MKVTQTKGGAGEKTVDAASIQIPDLWHIADWLDGEATLRKRPELAKHADMIRECWGLTHSLLRHAQA